MSLLELAGTRYPIPVGEVVLGSDPSCAIRITGPGILGRHAVVQGQADGAVVIRKASAAAEVLINGVRLGAEPTPLLHGDKVEAEGQELAFVDERRSGSTQFVQALTPAPGPTDAAGTATGRGGAKTAAVGTTRGRGARAGRGRAPRRPARRPRSRRRPVPGSGSSTRCTASALRPRARRPRVGRQAERGRGDQRGRARRSQISCSEAGP